MPEDVPQRPAVLDDLEAFQAEHGFENYAQGFGLVAWGAGSGLDTWSEDPEFLSGLVPFAQANASGSFYALWTAAPGATGADDAPVVVFGDEGGEHVVAAGLEDFLGLLAADVEIMVDFEDASFWADADEDLEPSPAHDAYLTWLGSHGIAPASEPAPVVDAARAEYGDLFSTWVEKFVAG